MKMELTYHEVCSWFPRMPDAEREALKADLQDNGCRNPIGVRKGQIFDGRHRFELCKELDINCPVKELSGTEEDAIKYAISMNLHRRHLDTSQRALIAAELAKRPHGDQSRSANLQIVQETAEKLNVSPRSVEAAKKVLEQAVPEIVDDVRQGKRSVHDAAVAADATKKAQRAARAKVERGEAKNLQSALSPAAATSAKAMQRLEDQKKKSGKYDVAAQDHRKKAQDAIGQLARALDSMRLSNRECKAKTFLSAIKEIDKAVEKWKP